MELRTEDPGNDFLQEFQSFLAFLKNLWGLLAGFSVFFPLSNVLVRVIPLVAYDEEGGVFDQITPSLITVTATIVTLFTLLLLFASRDRFRVRGARQHILKKTRRTFAAGAAMLILYLIIHQMYLSYAWPVLGWGSGDPRKLLAEIPLMVCYVGFFALITRSFVLLGMLEYFDAKRERGQGRGRPIPKT